MSGNEFEDYVARIARSCGLPVIMTSITGDWGVDIIVGKRPNRLAIQCKRQSRPVGAGAIQEVVAGAPMQDCTRTMVVTNHEFTPAARKLAELHGCELVGGAELPGCGRRSGASRSRPRRPRSSGARRAPRRSRHRSPRARPSARAGTARCRPTGQHDHPAIPQPADQLVALRGVGRLNAHISPRPRTSSTSPGNSAASSSSRSSR